MRPIQPAVWLESSGKGRGLGWLLLLLVAWISYAPGLVGGFLFDDFANLKTLGDMGGVRDWDTFRAYLVSGFSGPTGRPLSLLSFLLDAQDWPADPAPFKRTNLLLHLLTATVLWRVCRRVLQVLAPQASQAQTEQMACLAAGIWLLHPFLLSTTLYLVQRMAQLAALCVFLGLWAYLHGRVQLACSPRRGLVWMSGGVVVGTGLAVLSKENGALLPVLVLVLEWVLRSNSQAAKPPRYWLAVFAVLPSLAILGYMVSKFDFSDRPWPSRPFDQPERLWSQARIVWDYLGHLLLPGIEGKGLLQDDYVISTGWWSPPSTTFAVAGLVLLLVLGLWCRWRHPSLSLAILFFLAGHLMESTWLGLELYFEHRNYLPSAFLFLPLATALARLAQHWRPVVVGLAAMAVLGVLAFLLYQRAGLWADTTKLEAYWATDRPDSARAHNYWAVQLLSQGEVGQARLYLDKAVTRIPDSAVLRLLALLVRMQEGSAQASDFDDTAQFMTTARFDVQAHSGLQALADQARSQPLQPAYVSGALRVLRAAELNPDAKHFGSLQQLFARTKAQLLLATGDWAPALAQMRVAMDGLNDVDAALALVVEMAVAQRYEDALLLMPKVRQIFAAQESIRMRRPASDYRMEIDRLERQLREDMAAQ